MKCIVCNGETHLIERIVDGLFLYHHEECSKEAKAIMDVGTGPMPDWADAQWLARRAKFKRLRYLQGRNDGTAR